MYNMMNISDMINVGPVAMQYICPSGLGSSRGRSVMTSDMPYKNGTFWSRKN